MFSIHFRKQPKKARPEKPPNRAAIIEWFKDMERSRGAGLDPKTDQLADWFHGKGGREIVRK